MQYEEIMRRCHELTHGPIYAIPEDRMAEIVMSTAAGNGWSCAAVGSVTPAES